MPEARTKLHVFQRPHGALYSEMPKESESLICKCTMTMIAIGLRDSNVALTRQAKPQSQRCRQQLVRAHLLDSSCDGRPARATTAKPPLGDAARPMAGPALFSLPGDAHPATGCSSVASSDSSHAATAPPADAVSRVLLPGSHAVPVVAKEPLTAVATA